MNDKEERLLQAEAEIRRLREALDTRERFIRETFGRYLTDEVLEEILRNRDSFKIGGERRVVTIMFADLRRSTELSEKMDAAGFIRMLDHFLEEMIELVNAWQGNIFELAGDGIVAAWGAPRQNDCAARDAAACAVAMQRRMPVVNAWNREQGYPEIAMGVGLHTGEAILGNIGSPTRTKYDMIGRNVNLTSRIQGYARGGQILVTRELLAAAGDQVSVVPEGTMTVLPKGIQTPIQVYEVKGFGKLLIPEVENG